MKTQTNYNYRVDYSDIDTVFCSNDLEKVIKRAKELKKCSPELEYRIYIDNTETLIAIL